MRVRTGTARKADKYILPDGREPSEAEPGERGISSADADEIARLASLSPIDYEFERFGAAERIGCRLGVLDRAVADFRKSKEASERPMAAPDPWPEPVDGLELLAQIAATMRRFLILPPYGADAMALWVVHAHALDAAYFSPILLLTSPEMRCGKTSTLGVLRALCPKPITVANGSGASLFRAIEAHRPTLLIDEADTFLDKREDIRGIIDAGHDRNAVVMRVVGGEARAFSVWSPKVVAGIGRRAGTIEDRSVIIRLRRKLPTEHVDRFRPDRAEPLADLCRQAARWAADNLEILRTADPDMPRELNDRAADNWRALAAIADLAGGDWPDIARQAAIALSGGEADDDPMASPGVQLLADTRRVFTEQGQSLITPRDLVNALGLLEEAAFGRGAKPLSTKALADLLHPFGIKSHSPARVLGRKPARHYWRGDFDDAWARYLPQDHVSSVTSVASVTSGESMT